MQSRARTLAPAGDPQALAYLDLLASSDPLAPAFPAPPTEADAAALAYLELLASDGPVKPPSDPEAAYRELLASDGPMTPAAGQETAYFELLASDGPIEPDMTYLDLLASNEPLAPLSRTASSRRRPTSHRAATRPVAFQLLGERGRYAVLAAALVAGVSVAGVSAVATVHADQAQAAQTRTAAHKPLTASATVTPKIASGQTGVASAESLEPVDGDTSLSFARNERKIRPVPVVPAVPVAKWVNPLPEAGVTSCFGQRWGRLHAGIDLATTQGTRIRSVGAGRVVAAGSADGYGNAVLIDHGNGYLTHYGHLLDITVTVGQQLTAGQEIGHEGSTGHSTGPHLHFEVHQGTYKNPIEPTAWLRTHGVDIPGCTTPTETPKATPAKP